MAAGSGALDIPLEVWDHIISLLRPDHHFHLHLQHLSLACKYFLSIANRSHLSLNIHNPIAEIDFLPYLLRRFPNLNHLSFSPFSGDLDSVLHRIADFKLPLLQTLDLSNQDHLPGEALQRFPASVLSGVKSFKICALSIGLVDEDLEMIANLFPNLEELDLSPPNKHHFLRNNDDDDDDFDGHRNRHMRYHHHRDKLPTADGVSVLASKLKGCLRRMNLKGNNWVWDKVVMSICQHCPNLEELVLNGCKKVTEKGIAFALRTCPNLKTIHCMECSASEEIRKALSHALNLSSIVFFDTVVSNAALDAIAKAQLPLKSFSLINCRSPYHLVGVLNFAGLLSFLETYDSLHHLALVGVQFLSDASMGILTKSLTMVRSFRLHHGRCYHQEQYVSDSTLVTLIQQCPFLETLEISHSAYIRDASDLCGVTNTEIRTLDLSFNYNLSDECLEKIALACPNLERLQVRGCPQISKKGVGEILRNCHSLKHLNMNKCSGVESLGLEDMNTDDKQHLELQFLGASESGVDDKALIDIAGKCPHLMSLNVGNCEGLTTGAVKQLVDKCTRLKEINLRRCKNVRMSILPWMVFCNQTLRIILPPGHLSVNEVNLYLRHGCCTEYD